MLINWQQRVLNLKIVYYGPALSGKTTNVEKIFARVNPERRSDLISLKTHGDRTLFFDFLELELGKIGVLTPKLHLYTVPGQTYYEASRRLVLRGADGVVFVADSDPGRLIDNLESWRKMREHVLSVLGSVEGLPVVVQCNKQDLPNALSTTELGQLMGLNGYPTLGAVAIKTEGVAETLRKIVGEVVAGVLRAERLERDGALLQGVTNEHTRG